MMALTSKQWYQIASGAVSSLITSAALFNPLVGQDIALKLVAGLGIANIILSSVGATLSGVDSSAQDVATAAASKTLSPSAQVNILNAAGDVPGTSRVVNPTFSAIAATSSKVTTQ